jgi:toxin YoeB
MNITFTQKAWDDYLYWQEHDSKVLKRIHELMKDIDRSPFSGLGKPEPLRHNLTGYWSRRISSEHRLVYKQFDHGITYVQMRYHYDK